MEKSHTLNEGARERLNRALSYANKRIKCEAGSLFIFHRLINILFLLREVPVTNGPEDHPSNENFTITFVISEGCNF